jgi:hypothetical protein
MGALAFRLVAASRGARLQAALPVVAVAVATMLMLLTVAAHHGFDRRAQRTAWRTPSAAADPVARHALRSDFADGRPVTIVDLAALDGHGLAPPGLDRAPEPGELWVSPALADTMRSLPGDLLADRFDAAVTGTIDAASLAHPDELLAIVGQAPDSPTMSRERAGVVGQDVPPTAIAAWSTAPDDTALSYRLLAQIGAVLMIVPLLALGGSAARLVAARRNRRLALLRIIGGSPAQVVGLTAAEAGVLGGAGALLGGAGYALVLPWAAAVSISGGGWFVRDLWLGPVIFTGVLLTVTALVTASAVAGLLPVVRAPFATARAQRPGTARVWRLAAMAAAIALFWVNSSGGWRAVAIPLAAVLIGFTVVGPWCVRIFGLLLARVARRAPGLMAGRRLVDDPRGGWRAVAGMVLAAFIAGYLAVAVPGDIADSALGPDDRLRLIVADAEAGEVADAVRARLRAAGIDGDVGVDDPPSRAASSDRTVWITAAGHADPHLDRTRTALAGIVPGVTATTLVDDRRRDLVMFDDVRMGGLIVLLSAFLVAAVSAGVGGISRVLDQQGPLTLVRLAGAQVRVLAAARRREVMAPLALFGGGAGLLGVALGALTVGGIGLAPDGRWPALFGGLAVAGILAVLGADLLSRPVLTRVTADLSARE